MVDLGRMFHININVTDMERSRAFYQSLGFRVIADFHMGKEMTAIAARALQASPADDVHAIYLRLGSDPVVIDLCQWINPDAGESPKRGLYNAGIARIAFHVDDIEKAYQGLKDLGVSSLGPLEHTPDAGQGSAGVFSFTDPDGTVLEVLSGVEHLVSES